MKNIIYLTVCLACFFSHLSAMELYIPLHGQLYITNKRDREMMAKVCTRKEQKEIQVAGNTTIPVGFLADITAVYIWSTRGMGSYAPSMNVDLRLFNSFKKETDGVIILENNDSPYKLLGRTTKIATDIYYDKNN